MEERVDQGLVDRVMMVRSKNSTDPISAQCKYNSLDMSRGRHPYRTNPADPDRFPFGDGFLFGAFPPDDPLDRCGVHRLSSIGSMHSSVSFFTLLTFRLTAYASIRLSS